jgi:hypothetical protein
VPPFRPFLKPANFTLIDSLKPDSAIGIVGQQNFSIILGAHGLFWIEGIASYFEIQNGSECLRLKKNEVE